MDPKDRVDALAALMDEFRLSEAELTSGDFRIAFRKTRPARQAPRATDGEGEDLLMPDELVPEVAAASPPVPQGTPVTSPMNGIFYSSPSPNAPPFVREGESVTAGQVVGLIEAMKVFNEIVAPLSGTVGKVVAKNGDLVQPGELLLTIS